MERYILNTDGEPEECADLMTWGRWMQDAHARRVAWTEFDGGYVSTVFLGLNHAFVPGLPVLWETMIFGGPHHGYQDRYTSRAAAEHGHRQAVDLALSADAVDPSAADSGTPSTRDESSVVDPTKDGSR